MTDIVERLRKRMVRRELGDDPLVKVFGDAADEIEKLRAVLREVLDRQRDAVAIVNKQGAAFPGSLALACEKARAALGEAKDE